MKNEEFRTWAYYTNYVCVLATNGSCCHEFLKRVRELNPDFGFLEEVSKLYKRKETPEVLGKWIDFSIELCEREEFLSLSHHFLHIGRKK